MSSFKASDSVKEEIVTSNDSSSRKDYFSPRSPVSSTTIVNPMTTTTTSALQTTTTKKVTTHNFTTTKSVATTKPAATTTTKAPATTTRAAAPSDFVSVINYTPTQQEWDMFCTVVSSETGYCSETIQKHVAHTVINRVKHMLSNSNSPFPKTLYGILTQQGQYTCISNYFYGTYRSGMAPGSAGWNNTMRIIKEAWNEPDPINGGIGYYNPNMGGLNYWFENNLQFCYQDSVARYFRLK
jgi:hypothetical protein